MNAKLIDNKRRMHAAKVLEKLSQAPKETHHASETEPKADNSSSEKKGVAALREQYDVIREDLMKLRDDVTKGYDLAKGFLNKKTIMNELKNLR